jgi:hypothetical protein
MEPSFDSSQLGRRYIQGSSVPFGLDQSDRRQHLYVIGKTGTGKSTLLRNLLVQDILAGRGVGLIDPHGDLVEAVLDVIPRWRTGDVVYFNPADTDFPIGLNILECNQEKQKHLVAAQVVSIFRNMWPEFWGPRLEHILYASCASLIVYGRQTILGIPRLLTDSNYRSKIVKQIEDPFLRSFWDGEFATYSKEFASEAIAPVLNKVGRLTMSPLLRNIIGQPQSGFDPAFMMDNRRIFIANLSKGLLGEEQSNLLGSILVAKFQLAAMARASMPEEEREDFSLYVDEFQNFTTESFASILEEARKYHLCLTLAHQHTGQLSERLRSAVLGNVGSILAFRVGSADAEILAKEFNAELSPSQLTELSNHTVCAKLLDNGNATQPFTGWMLPEMDVHFGRKDIITRCSREKYGTRKEQVEERLKRWMQPKERPRPTPQNYRRRLS